MTTFISLPSADQKGMPSGPCREGGLCFLHSNPKKAAELRRIGGKKNRHIPGGISLPPLESANAGGTLDRGGGMPGRLHPRTGEV
jgi:hypothetical protein